MPPVPSVPAQPVNLPRSTAGFHLRRELGRGGMGVVYEAQEISTGRTVALKVLLQDLALSSEAMERFQREARLAAAISHAHCVFVSGAHSIEGAPAIAMELIGGETLEHKVRRGEPIPIETAVRWGIDLLDGLDAAHRAGVLHRDVKPSNCFVTTEERVKVGDFGLSRSLERDIQLTQSGQFLGSPLYASPEQIRGRAFDVRSDLYSCGATIYAILTGRPPFSGGNVGEVLARILSEDPPHPRSIRPEISRALEAVLLRSMERDPEKRWQTLHEFRTALEPFATRRTEVAAPWRRIGAYIIDVALHTAVVLTIVGSLRMRVMDMQSPTGHVVSAVLSLAYYALFEGLLGWGPGKWLFGLRVVSDDTHEPSLWGATLRVLVFSGPSFLSGTIIAWLTIDDPRRAGGWQLASTAAFYAINFVTARRRNGWRGIHDFASNTHVIPLRPPFLRARLQAPPPEMELARATGLPASVGDYAVEGVIGSTPSGTMIKARDATLERSVWIHLPATVRSLADDGRRALTRPGRLRWLDFVRSPAGDADVFESPGGSSLPVFSVRHGSIDWPNAQRLLLGLVEELMADHARFDGIALEQVWIDRNWDVRLLDEPVGSAPFTRHAPVALVREAARALFVGAAADAPVLPVDLPFHAEPAVARLMGLDGEFADLDSIRGALTLLSAGPALVQSRTRGAQLAINVLLPAALTGVIVLLAMLVLATIPRTLGVRSMVQELATGHTIPLDAAITSTEGNVVKRETSGPELTDEQRRAREILVVDACSSSFGTTIVTSNDPEEQKAIRAALAHHPRVSDADVAWAEEAVRAESGWTGNKRREWTGTTSNTSDDAPGSKGWLLVHHFPVVAGFSATILWGLFALPIAFVFRGGLTFTMFGIRVRNRRGRRASRWLSFVRCFLAWLPLALGSYWVMKLCRHEQNTAAMVVAVTVGLVYVGAIVEAILHPARCVVDRVLRTRLVPR